MLPHESRLTVDRLKQLLSYDPLTGAFVWLVSSSRTAAGTVAGSPDDAGYLRIGVDGVRYRAHRLAFLYMTGEWPEDQVDHINGVRTDNRWVNLRDVSDGVNKQNRQGPTAANTSGYLGVSYWGNRRGQKKHVAQLVLAGKRIHCSYHRTPEEAHTAYLAAKREHHPGNTL